MSDTPLVVRKCANPPLTMQERREAKARAERAALRTRMLSLTGDDRPMIYVQVRYVCIGFRVDDDLLARNHALLNQCLLGQNPDINRVPNTTRNPWAARVASARIQFLRPTNDVVELLQPGVRLGSSSPLVDAQRIAGQVPGMMNVYIGATTGGNVLGQAFLGSNRCFCHISTIGDATNPGAFGLVGQGKTLVHEIGHCLRLPHPFETDNPSTAACDGVVPFTTHPEQLNNNQNARVVFTNGQWDIVDDNRFNDRASGNLGQTSCLGQVPGAPYEELNEMACQFMDYSRDDSLLMFSDEQVEIMREWLEAEIAKPPGTGPGAAALVEVQPTDELTAGTAVEAEGGGTLVPPSGDGDSGLSPGAIGGIVAGVAVAAIILIVIARNR